MNILRPWFFAAISAFAGTALAGGGASSDHVRYEVLPPHVLLEESRLWKLPGFTTGLAQKTVADGFQLAPGAELPWDTLRGIHAKVLTASGQAREMNKVIVILRFAERTRQSDPLSRAQAGDLIYCSAYIAVCDFDRVRQSSITG